MSSARGNNRDAFINPYELQKIAQCARNQKKIDELRLAQCARALQQPTQPIQPRKRKKITQVPKGAAANNHNLRPRLEKPSSKIAIEEIANCETVGDLSDNEDDHELDSLLKYWRSPESHALATRGKANRAKLKFLHTSGSVSYASYASAAHKLGQQLGRPPRRDEVYIKTHTRKNGVPLSAAAETINELKEAVQVYPELMEKTIQQGDVFAVVCGLKEPKGRVRCLGLGPTPQDIGTPGLKSYTSTRLQIQVLAREKAKSEVLVLQQRLLEMQQREEQRMAQEFSNAETLSQHGSNSRQPMSPRSEEPGEADQHIQGDEDDYLEDDNYDEEEPDDEANEEATIPPAMNVTTTPRKVQQFAHDSLAGNEVILFAMKSNEKVAKATVVSVNPNNKLADVPLGIKFCEVTVDIVLRREALVPRPYADIKTVGDAEKMPIAWPFN